MPDKPSDKFHNGDDFHILIIFMLVVMESNKVAVIDRSQESEAIPHRRSGV